jgi:hypothetical protein
MTDLILYDAACRGDRHRIGIVIIGATQFTQGFYLARH